MDHKIILKCRVCLGEFDEAKMFDLFSIDTPPTPDYTLYMNGSYDGNKTATVGGEQLKLAEKLEFCCGVRIRESSEMPTKMCMICFDITRIWFNFRQMCVNSQVFLESMCNDRCSTNNQPDCEDKYLKYLLEDLQTFRSKARHANVGFSLNIETDNDDDHNTSDSANSGIELNQTDSDNEYLRGLPLDAADLVHELENIENIKKEQHNEVQLDVTEKKKTRKKGVTGMQRQQRRNVEKKTNGYNDKKRLRSSPPTTYMCSICGNVYTKKASFAYHMSMHSNVKPHECELCGKSFRQVCELKNHMRRHTGEKPYKCSHCDRYFIHRSGRHRHERIHTNTRPYVCSLCGKSFMYSDILKNHLKWHSGEKEYNCLVCQKAFTLQHHLKAHLQTITHKQKESEFVN